jgi:DNA-binding transcriptional ArsR family regulator
MGDVAATAAAIGDPVRRAILDRLREGPRTAGSLGGGLPISRPAVSRHLRVLRECGLVVDEARGRERVYRVDPGPLAELEAWLARFRVVPTGRFGAALDALATEVHRTKRQRSRPASTQRQERTA